MSLVNEIIQGSIDDSCDLGMLLRKCKVFSLQLRSKPLEDWLIFESNGYPEDAYVPKYRIWPLKLKGYFVGSFGAELRNVEVPLVFLPREVRPLYEQYKCRQSVGSIEQLVKKNTGLTPRVQTGDLSAVFGTRVFEGMSCLSAWAEFPEGNLLEVLNAVRNRILDFSLAMQKEIQQYVDQGDENHYEKIEPSRVNQIFNMIVQGDNANIIGTVNIANIDLNIEIGDFSTLSEVLKTNGISSEDIKMLKAALEEEPNAKLYGGKFGPKVNHWISKMFQRACDGGWDIAIGVAGNLLSQAIMRYYGI